MTQASCYSKDPKIFIIRHGSTDMNKEGGSNTEDKIRGWIDVPLNGRGIQDAKKVGKALAKESPEAILCSDLSRTMDTSMIINSWFNVPVLPSIAFRPWNLGVYQGQESNKVQKEMAFAVKNPNSPIPEGEPFGAFVKRFLTALQKVVAQVQNSHCDIFIVTHYRNSKLADAWVKRGMPKDLSYDVKTVLEDNVKPGEFNVIRPNQ